jgi:hypothetical protein
LVKKGKVIDSISDYPSLRDIALDTTTPQHIRESAIERIILMDTNIVSLQLKHKFLSELLTASYGNTKFKSFLKKKINQIFQHQSGQKNTTVLSRSVKDLTTQDKKTDREFLNETVALIRKGIKKSGPWGILINDADAKRLLKFGVLDQLGIYMHRRRFTDHKPVPYTHVENSRDRIVAPQDVIAWKKTTKPLLMSFSNATEEILEARTRFKVMENRLNIVERYVLKDLSYKIKTNRGNLVIRTDFVGLRKTELGMKGQWVVSILGLHKRFYNSMNALGWTSLDSFCDDVLFSKEGLSQELLSGVLVMKCTTDEEAQRELAIFLEEVLVEFFNAKIVKFELLETLYEPNEIKIRRKEIGRLKQRTEWIIRNPRGPIINHCLVCGKALSVSISVQREIGPHCWEKLSHEKELKMIDLNPNYVPFEYETALSLQDLLNALSESFRKLVSA